MKLSIVIVSYNTRQLLKDCLDSVIRLNSLSHPFSSEVIVVDNASSDGSPDMVKKEFPQVKLIKNQTNLGFASANNQGIKASLGEYLLLLNSDTVLTENSLAVMVEWLSQHPKVGILGPKLLNQDGSFQPSGGYFPALDVIFRQSLFLDKIYPFSRLKMFKVVRHNFYQTPQYLDWVSGACLLARKKVFDQIGLLDENFFMYVEEVEFCFRAKKQGWQVSFLPQVQVFHLGEGSGYRSQAISGIYQGLAYYYEKHYPYYHRFILKIILKVGAVLRILLGKILNNKDLVATYEKAYQLV